MQSYTFRSCNISFIVFVLVKSRWIDYIVEYFLENPLVWKYSIHNMCTAAHACTIWLMNQLFLIWQISIFRKPYFDYVKWVTVDISVSLFIRSFLTNFIFHELEILLLLRKIIHFVFTFCSYYLFHCEYRIATGMLLIKPTL